MEDTSLPLSIFSVRVLDDGNVGIDAITAYGRRVTVVLPRWNTTGEGIDAALRRSWVAQVEADQVLSAVQASWAADERDPYAVDDSNPDATAG